VTTKKDIVKVISDKTGITQVDTKRVLQCMFEAVIDSLATTGRIELRNFGVFQVKVRAQRKARNPRTGEEVIVPAKRVVKFRPGKLMEARLV